MSSIIFPNRWTSKPPLGSQINWGHPLSQGLVGCWLMNEGGGAKVSNLVTKISMIPVGTNFNWYANNIQHFDPASMKGLTGEGSLISSTNDCTVIVKYWGDPLGESADRPIFTRGKDGAGNGWNVLVFHQSGGNIGGSVVTTNPGIAGVTVNGTVKFTSKWGVVAFTFKQGGNLLLYANGILNNTTNNTSSSLRTSTNGINFCRNNGTGDGNGFSGYIQYIYFYNCALSPSEIQQLYIEPYCFMEPRRRRFYPIGEEEPVVRPYDSTHKVIMFA